MRIRSTTSVCRLHGLVLLPCRISGKMTTSRNHFYLCFASCLFYCHAALPTTCYIMPPILPCQPLIFSPFLANRCLALLPLLLSPSSSVVRFAIRHSYHLLYHASHTATSAPNLFTLPSKPLFGYVTAFAQPLL